MSYSIFLKSTVCRWVVHHSHYISLTLSLWTCQRIIQYTIQSSRVLSAPAGTPPLLSLGHKSSPPGVCMQSQSPETSMLFLRSHCPCFDSGCMLVALDECSVRSRNERYSTQTMKDVTRCRWMGIIMVMAVFKCPSLNLATVVLLDRLRCIMLYLFDHDRVTHSTPDCADAQFDGRPVNRT